MNIAELSSRYSVRRLDRADAGIVLSLCAKNGLFYRYCPPGPSEESVIRDMQALPPKKDISDKYFLGYFRDGALIAVLDLIAAYPDEKTAFIGFFMTDTSVQNKGTGSGMIGELCAFLRRNGFSRVRLGWVKGNPQSEHFWHKCGFTETGGEYRTDAYTVIAAQKEL